MDEDISLREAAALLIPLRQGKLDNLCGLYSILNAIRLASWPTLELNHFRSRPLFDHGIAYLERKGLLRATLAGGMFETTWRGLGEALIKEAQRREWIRLTRLPLLEKVRGADLATVVAAIDHHTRGGAPVLMALHGGYNHYSVIVEVRDQRLILFDSSGYRWVSIDACEIGRGRRTKRHQLGYRSSAVIRCRA